MKLPLYAEFLPIENFIIKDEFLKTGEQYLRNANTYQDYERFDDALISYDKAAELYTAEGSKDSADYCLLGVATMAAEMGDYMTAAPIYEKITANYVGNKLYSINTREYIVETVMLYLCGGDTVKARNALCGFLVADPYLAETYEYFTASKIISYCENKDILSFRNDIFSYDRNWEGHTWRMRLLLRLEIRLKEDCLDKKL